MSYPANDPMDPREREVASDAMWHRCADCNAAGAEFRLKRDRYLCEECAARLHAQEIAVIQELLAATKPEPAESPAEPEDVICAACHHSNGYVPMRGSGDACPVCGGTVTLSRVHSPAEPAQDTRGWFSKFTVTRNDGTDKPGGKHDGCDYFVLDLTHDKHAKAAILAYADDCEKDRPQLAMDLRVRMGKEPWAISEPAQDDECSAIADLRAMLAAAEARIAEMRNAAMGGGDYSSCLAKLRHIAELGKGGA